MSAPIEFRRLRREIVAAGLAALSLAFVVFIVSTPSAYAQAAAATLTGTVHDDTGAVVPDVQIAILNVANAGERKVTTDRAGSFTLVLLQPGSYVVTAQREGFAKAEVRDVVLNANDQLALDIPLKVQGEIESVSVVAETSRSSVAMGTGTVVDRQFIANMPLNGRSLQSLLQLVPGVILAPSSGTGGTAATQFSVNGQRTTSNYFTVDGLSANTGMSASTAGFPGAAGAGQAAGTTALGGTNSLSSLDAVQEVRVESSTFAPEFGRTTGGQISLLTRSGTNQPHGTVSEYFRHDAMDANDWFADAAGLPKAKERQHLFGGVFGGPIRHNRVFFFGSYEGLRLDQPAPRILSVPSTAIRSEVAEPMRSYLKALPLPNGPDNGDGTAQLTVNYSDQGSFDAVAGRVDAQITKSLNSFFRLNHSPSQLVQHSSPFASSVYETNVVNDSVTVGGNWTATDRQTIDIRVNWTRNRPESSVAIDTIGGAVVPAVSDTFRPGANPANAAFSFFGPSDLYGFQWGTFNADTQRQLNVVGTAAWLLRSHQLKFGIDYRRMSPLLGASDSLETVITDSLQEVLAGQATVYALVANDPSAREPIFSNLSLYAQDAWRASQRLTVTYGLRFERVPPPSESSGRLPRTLLGIDGGVIDNPRLAPQGTPLWRSRVGEFAPRLGVAYQLRTLPRWETTLRAGVGVFYDLGLGDSANAFQNMYPFQAIAVGCCDLPLPLSPEARTPPVLGIGPPSQLTLLDPSVRMPYTTQWSGVWEQGMGAMQTLTIAYVGSVGRRQLAGQNYTVALSDWPGSSTALLLERNIGKSSYNAMQVQFQRRLHRGLQTLVSYTLAHAEDNASEDGGLTPPPGASLAREFGNANFDVRHQVSSAVTYDVPNVSSGSPLAILLDNWGLDLLLRAQSALPFGPFVKTAVTPDGLRYSIRPDLIQGQAVYLDDPSAPGGRRVNRAAFASPPPNQQGNMPRNSLRAYAAWQLDLALRREFALINPVRLQLRAECFNVLNHPNFGSPENDITSDRFGLSSSMLNRSLGGLNALYQMGGPRSVQLSVKALF